MQTKPLAASQKMDQGNGTVRSRSKSPHRPCNSSSNIPLSQGMPTVIYPQTAKTSSESRVDFAHQKEKDYGNGTTGSRSTYPHRPRDSSTNIPSLHGRPPVAYPQTTKTSSESRGVPAHRKEKDQENRAAGSRSTSPRHPRDTSTNIPSSQGMDNEGAKATDIRRMSSSRDKSAPRNVSLEVTPPPSSNLNTSGKHRTRWLCS